MQLCMLLMLCSGCVPILSSRIIHEDTPIDTPKNPIITVEVTKEVTRILLLYPTSTPSITNPPSCCDTAGTQYELNPWATPLAEEARIEMEQLVIAITKQYSSNPQALVEFLR